MKTIYKDQYTRISSSYVIVVYVIIRYDADDDNDDNLNDDDHTALSVLKGASHDWHLSKADGIDAPLVISFQKIYVLIG